MVMIAIFLVSNTGTLLDMFRRNATDKVAMESNLLTAISSSESQSQEFQLRGDKTVKVCVHNLGLRNNSVRCFEAMGQYGCNYGVEQV